ncbi:MAG: hypothetical protein ABI776_03565, partial [Nocardioidaceae bacterium]
MPAGGTAISMLTTCVEEAGGIVTALDVTASGHDRLRIDVTCAASDTAHADRIVLALRGVEGVTVHKVSDRTFLMHLGGVIAMESKHPIRNRDDLSMVYTPGVARVCEAIAANPEDARRLTVKRNVMFGPKMSGQNYDSAEREARLWLDLVGLNKFADTYP